MASRTAGVEIGTTISDATHDRRSVTGAPTHEGCFSAVIKAGLITTSVLTVASEASITLYTVPIVGVGIEERRYGKEVTVVKGLDDSDVDLKRLAPSSSRHWPAAERPTRT